MCTTIALMATCEFMKKRENRQNMFNKNLNHTKVIMNNIGRKWNDSETNSQYVH